MNNSDPSEHRYFVALSASSDLKKQYIALPRNELDAKWHQEDDLHITIRFLGPLDLKTLEDVRLKLHEVHFRPFFAQISGLDAFYNKNQSILYAKVESTRKLTSLCTDITDKLTPLGFDFGTRPYVPHITFCRVKKNKSLAPYIKKYEKNIHSQWNISDFKLMKSVDRADSAMRYEVIEKYILKN